MAKRKIKAKRAVEDILSGMNDLELMDKYGITDRGLQSLFNKLVRAGLLTRDQIEDRESPFVSTVTIEFDTI